MLIAMVLQFAVPDAAVFDRRTWARFSRGPALSRTEEKVAIATDGYDPSTRRTEHVFRLIASEQDQSEALWASTRTCPAARNVVARFATLPPPRAFVPDGDPGGDIVIIMDGVDNAVTAPLGYDSTAEPVTLRSNANTPLAHWVDGALAMLQPCWSAVKRRAR